MTTASRIRQPAATHVPAPAVALLAAGCSVHDQPAHHTATDQPAGGRTAASTSSPAAGGHSSTPDLAAARAWAIAANSSCYLDPSPGAWTVRARPLTTRPETRAEVAQRTGGGEISRMQIQADKCVTPSQPGRVRPSDAPSGPDLHIAYVSTRVALACATGTVELSDFAAQLAVQRVSGRSLNALARH